MLTLRSEHLYKVYRRRAVVNDVSVTVKQGEIIGLLGPNGAGKTTSFYQIVGLIPPDQGKVFLGEEEITELPMYKRAQLGIGYLPQEASIFRQLTVEENVASVLEMTALNKREQKERLELLLSEFGLNRVRKSMGNVLSGGERRRTEIARALATNPKFILLDEPFAGIDPIAVEDIQRIVLKLKEKNIGVLITDHNVQETLSITDRAYLLFEGKILKQGNADELAADEQVRRVYLGQNFVLHKKTISEVNSHDSALDVVNYHSLIRYTDSMLSATERMIDVAMNADPRYLNTEMENAGYSGYLGSLMEYKTIITTFATEQQAPILLEKVSGIVMPPRPNPLMRILNFFVSIIPIISFITNREKYTDFLQDTRSTLQQLAANLRVYEANASNNN
jgi:lipopolysaccharide export system ATP-binding protein